MDEQAASAVASLILGDPPRTQTLTLVISHVIRPRRPGKRTDLGARASVA
jgi:hypothetical protein